MRWAPARAASVFAVVLWFALASVTAFLFWHIFINDGEAADDTVFASQSLAAIVILGSLLLLTIIVYGIFWVRNNQKEAHA